MTRSSTMLIRIQVTPDHPPRHKVWPKGTRQPRKWKPGYPPNVVVTRGSERTS